MNRIKRLKGQLTTPTVPIYMQVSFPNQISSCNCSLSNPLNLWPLQVDAGTSDDSGRASERLTNSSIAHRDTESSRDRMSDVSSHFFNAISSQQAILKVIIV